MSDKQTYWTEDFDSYDVALAWFTYHLSKATSSGDCLRAAALDFDIDYDTKKGRWRAMVRIIPVSHEFAVTPSSLGKA